MKNVTVIGSGSWGMALAIYLAKIGHNIKVWSFSEEEANLINNEKKCMFLPKVKIPENILCTTNMEEAISGSEILLIVTPSKFVRDTVKKFKNFVTNQQIIICSKGLEEGTLYTLTQIVEEEIPGIKVGALSGPSHAEEVSVGIPTAMVIASEHDEVLKNIQDSFMSEVFRIYTSKDVLGVEVGSALKNIIAFCAGVAAGLGYGDNTFAALVTRGLAEISRLGVEMGANKDTFYGLTGIGDLIVTCLSQHSRNRRAGVLIAEGKTVEEAKKEVGMTIESIDNIKVAYDLMKKHDVLMPIVDAVYNVLFNGADAKDGVNMLMTRDKKGE